MRLHRIVHISATLVATLLNLGLALTASAQANGTVTEFPNVVPVQIGDIEFAPGDSITIERVTGSSASIQTGGVYCVEGTYTLASRDEALLGLSITTVKNVSTPIGPNQTMRVQKGSGSFRLVQTMWAEGYPHASFSSWPHGSAFCGVYFGQDPWVLRHKGWSWLDQQTQSPQAASKAASANAPISVTGPNRALLEYLGNPVEPPADMNAAYSKDGLLKAVQTAASNAGVAVTQVEIDDSEFPFLVGIVCKEGDYEKLKEQFRKMPGYDYGGSVGSHTCYALNLVPWRAFPPEASQRISHRLGVRMQVFQAKLREIE